MKTSTIVFHLASGLTLVAVYAIWVAVALYEGEGIPVGEMIIFGCVMAVLYVVYVRRYGPQGILLRPRTTARQRCDALTRSNASDPGHSTDSSSASSGCNELGCQ